MILCGKLCAAYLSMIVLILVHFLWIVKGFVTVEVSCLTSVCANLSGPLHRSDLSNWFFEAHKALVTSKSKYDWSGMNAFNYGKSFNPLDSQGFDVFCSNFANGQKAIMYFAALMYNHGKEMLDIFLR